MQVQIQEIGTSKSGKSTTVKASGKYYYLGKGAPCPPVGQLTEITTGSFSMGDKTFATIEAWKPVNSVLPRTMAPVSAAVPQVNAEQEYIDDASMRFISNCVGSAISAGTLKEARDIGVWALCARDALRTLNQPSREPGSDDDKSFVSPGLQPDERW